MQIGGTISDADVYENRHRVCDESALVVLYERPDGSIGYRCPSEPVAKYIAKGGNVEDTVGRGCLCNGLLSTVGLGNAGEAMVLTLGDDVSFLPHLMKDAEDSYSTKDAIDYLIPKPTIWEKLCSLLVKAFNFLTPLIRRKLC